MSFLASLETWEVAVNFHNPEISNFLHLNVENYYNHPHIGSTVFQNSEKQNLSLTPPARRLDFEYIRKVYESSVYPHLRRLDVAFKCDK